MLKLTHDGHEPQPQLTEAQQTIHAFNQAQMIGKERASRLRAEWIRIQGLLTSLEKDYYRKLKTIPLLETNIDILHDSFSSPIHRTLDELIHKRSRHEATHKEFLKKSNTLSRLSPLWHRAAKNHQKAFQMADDELNKYRSDIKPSLVTAKERAVNQAKTNNKLNQHRLKGITPLKWRIDDLKLVMEALEARCLAVSACVLAHKDNKAIAMASIWKRLQRNEAVGMSELSTYHDAEKEDLRSSEPIDQADQELRFERALDARIQEVMMQHSQAMVGAMAKVIGQLTTGPNITPEDKSPIVDADFVEINLDDFPLRDRER